MTANLAPHTAFFYRCATEPTLRFFAFKPNNMKNKLLATLLSLNLIGLTAVAFPVSRAVNEGTTSATIYLLDVDNNGVKDFMFFSEYLDTVTQYTDYIVGLNGNTIQTWSGTEAWCLLLGEFVGFNTNQWNDTALVGRNNQTAGAIATQNNGEGYVGLQFKIGNNTHKGWAKLRVSFGQTIIQSCGYETVPGEDILAGDGGVGISNVEFDLHASLYPNPVSNQLSIAIDETMLGAELNIYNSTGTLVGTSKFETVTAIIETYNYTPGIYIAELKTENGVALKRWVKM